jgi:hypothetical protein
MVGFLYVFSTHAVVFPYGDEVDVGSMGRSADRVCLSSDEEVEYVLPATRHSHK